jgi:allantoicase
MQIIETIIIIEKSGDFFAPKNRLITSENPIITKII